MTGVQTCALPISPCRAASHSRLAEGLSQDGCGTCSIILPCSAESYSRLVAPCIVPKATPGLLCRGLLLVWCAKTYSRFLCRELCRELLLVCCAESYYWFGVPRATPELCRDERQPIQHICRSSGAPKAIHNRASSRLRIWVVPAAWDAHPKIVGFHLPYKARRNPKSSDEHPRPGISQTIKIGIA